MIDSGVWRDRWRGVGGLEAAEQRAENSLERVAQPHLVRVRVRVRGGVRGGVVVGGRVEIKVGVRGGVVVGVGVGVRR